MKKTVEVSEFRTEGQVDQLQTRLNYGQEKYKFLIAICEEEGSRVSLEGTYEVWTGKEKGEFIGQEVREYIFPKIGVKNVSRLDEDTKQEGSCEITEKHQKGEFDASEIDGHMRIEYSEPLRSYHWSLKVKDLVKGESKLPERVQKTIDVIFGK